MASPAVDLGSEGGLQYTPEEVAAALEPHGFRQQKLDEAPQRPDGAVDVETLAESAFQGNGCRGVLVHADGRYLACIKSKSSECITVRDVLEDVASGRIVSKHEFANLVTRFPSFRIYGEL